MSLSKYSGVLEGLLESLQEGLEPVLAWASEHPSLAIGTVAATLATLYYLKQKAFAPRLPPGPPAFPVVGSILSLQDKKLYKDITRFKEKYGDVHTIWFGSTPCVILASYSAIKEVFLTRGNEFNSRPPNDNNFMKDLDDAFATKPFSEQFAREKKLVVSNLRTLGGFRAGADGYIVQEMEELVKELRELNQKPADIKDKALLMTTNIMAGICFNQRYSHDDPKLHKLRDLTLNFYAILNEFSPAEFFFPTFLAGLVTGDKYKRFMAALHDYEVYMEKSVEEHLETFDPKNLRDLVDIYLNKGDTPGRQLYHSVALILPDSIDSVAVFMRWVVLYLGHHPDVQKKIQKEIDEHVGPSQMVDVALRSKLKYTDAVMYEIMRISDSSTGTGFHSTIGDGSKFRGYDVPKNATLFASLYHVHKDPELFPEPETFKPERFLDANGDLTNTNHVIAFGIGRRMCIGEHLVKTELFVFLANLMHNFTVKFPTDEPKPTLEPAGGMIQYPVDFKAIYVPRD